MTPAEKRQWIEAELRMKPNNTVARSMYLAVRWVVDDMDLPANMLEEIIYGKNNPGTLP